MANVGAQTINPLDPSSIVAQQQLARTQAMADALRQQSLAPAQYDPRGAVSPWAGVAKVLAGVGASRLQGKADAKQLGLAAALQQARASQFGIGAPTPPPMAGNVPQPPPAPAGGTTGPAPAPPGPAQAPAASSPNPAAYAQFLQANPPPQPAPNPNVLPGMTPQQSYEMSVMDPDTYGKLRVAAGSPTDAMKNAGAAYGADTPEYTNSLRDVTRKAGFIEPTMIREGGAAMANDGTGRIWTAPKTEVGMQNIRDAQGNVVGQENVPGAVNAIAQSEAARAGGKAAGALPYETVSTFDPATGQMKITPKAATLNGGYATTAPMGAPQFADTSAKAGAQFFTGIADEAKDSPNRIYALNQMKGLLASGTQFGPGTDTAVKFADLANGIGKAFGFQGSFNAQNITNVNEFNKWAAQYSARAAADLGLGGSDARIAMSVAATPNGHMTNAALQSIIPQMVGLEASKQGMANAGAAYAQAHPGPNAQSQFLTKWRAAYDPQVFQITSLPPAEQAAAIGKLPPPQRAAMARKWQSLKMLGAF